MKKVASIVIRTFNEEKYLRRCLEAVILQEYIDFEIIIVDSGSSDSTLDIALDFECEVVHIKKEDFTFGRSLNYGCEVAKGDFLIFISAHCIPVNQRWLSDLIKPFSNKKVALVYGRQTGLETTKYSEYSVFEKYFPKDTSDQQGGFFCNNANSAIRKELWNKYNFNEKLTGLEDMDWAKNFYYIGYNISYCPTSIVYHIHEETWRKVKIRYERESVALRQIMPEVHFSFFDFIKAFRKGVSYDIRKSISDKKIISVFVEILFFRFCQFYGSYKGNLAHRKVSDKKKKNYFYP